MLTVSAKKYLISAFMLTMSVAVIAGLATEVSAQNDTQCSSPDFQITSSKDVTALVNESFTYFVVSDGDADYQLSSQLPTGLSFTDGKLSGTPQETGDYPLQFTANNECGSTTQTVMLSVVDSNQLAQANATTNQDQDVRLNEVPETGLSADQALTLSFYMLALLLISILAARRLYRTPATVVGNKEVSRPADDNSSTYEKGLPHQRQAKRKRVGEEINKTTNSR